MKYNPEIHHRKSIRLKDYDYSQAGAYFITICCENKLNRFGEITIVNSQNNIVGAGLAPALFDDTQSNQLQNNKINHIEKGQPQGIAPTGNCPDPTQYANEIKLNQYGQIAYDEWIKLSERFHNIELDVFQIMPNHIHGIIILNNNPHEQNIDGDNVGAGLAPALNNEQFNHFQNINTNNENNVEKGQSIVETGLAPALSNQFQNIGNNKIINHIGKGQPQGIAPTGGCPPPTIAKIIGSYKSLVSNKCLKISKANNEILGKFWQRNYYEHIIRNEKSYQSISEYIINNPSKWQEDKYYNI